MIWNWWLLKYFVFWGVPTSHKGIILKIIFVTIQESQPNSYLMFMQYLMVVAATVLSSLQWRRIVMILNSLKKFQEFWKLCGMFWHFSIILINDDPVEILLSIKFKQYSKKNIYSKLFYKDHFLERFFPPLVLFLLYIKEV